MNGLAGANYAKAFSKTVGVGKMYLQTEADAYRKRAQSLDMAAEDIARREFQAGRTLTDAELKGQAAPVTAVKTATPAPAPSTAPAPVSNVPKPTPAPTPAPAPSIFDTIADYAKSIISPEPVPAAQPMPTDAGMSIPSPAPQPITIPITYSATPPSPAQTVANATVSTLAEDWKKNWLLYGAIIGGVAWLANKYIK